MLAWASVLSTKIMPVTLFLGGVGVLVLLFVLWRGAEDLLGTALLLNGVAYVVGLLVGRHVLDESAPLVGAALLLCGELTTWSLEERVPIAADRGVRLARARAVVLLVLAGLAAAALVLAVSAGLSGNGLAWTFLGSVAAVLAVALSARLAALARRAG